VFGLTFLDKADMTWEQRYRLRLKARTSMVFWAVLALIAALLFAPVVRWMDRQSGLVLFDLSAEGARSILGTLAGSMLTFIVFVLSTTLIVVQLASAQLTPRVIAFVLGKTSVKVAMGTLTFTYAYTLSALSRVNDKVPELHVAVAIVLNLMCIVVFFQFVQDLSSGLRPASLMLHVAETGRRVIEQVYPSTYDPNKPEQTSRTSPTPTASQSIVFKGQSGVIMAMSTNDLSQLAEQEDVIIELIPQVGDFISRGDPLFRIFGSSQHISEDALRGCVAVGTERTVEQDPRFVFRILVDIANKALSPAINDPTTAVIALDHIDHLMLFLGKRNLDEGVARDRNGKLRLIYGTPDWPDYVILATSEIRQFGEGSLQINRRLRALLEHLINALPPVRRAALETELSMLGRSALRRFVEAEDLKRAGIPDHQGVGGSDT
jgi:uncharacterized membrane protein